MSKQIVNYFQRLFRKWQYDEVAAIRVLFDREQSLFNRGCAAESLYTGQTPTATAALLKLVVDETEHPSLREEAAGTLGSIYDVIGLDHQALGKIPSPYREEVLAGISRKVVSE